MKLIDDVILYAQDNNIEIGILFFMLLSSYDLCFPINILPVFLLMHLNVFMTLYIFHG